MQFVALDDFDLPRPGIGCCLGNARPLISGIGKDTLDEWPQRTGPFVENTRRTVAILNVGRMDVDAQQQAKRVDEDVPFATRNLLRAIIALRVERSPPFGLPFTL